MQTSVTTIERFNGFVAAARSIEGAGEDPTAAEGGVAGQLSGAGVPDAPGRTSIPRAISSPSARASASVRQDSSLASMTSLIDRSCCSPNPMSARKYHLNVSGTGRGASTSCGNAWISGTYSSDLTIGADNDVIVEGDVARADDGVLLGLIANNFVRVYHPVTFGSGPGNPACTNTGDTGTPRSRRTSPITCAATKNSWVRFGRLMNK
mgnify:CR=1 FL=1